MMYLRPADRLDARALATLRAASLVEIGVLAAGEREAFVAGATRAFFGFFAADTIAAWVACDDELLVGSCCAIFYDRLPYPDGSRHAELCGVYVRPEFRNRGVAGELVREVIGATRAAGARKTFLRPSERAKGLYARLGFVDTELMMLQSQAGDAAARVAWAAGEAGTYGA